MREGFVTVSCNFGPATHGNMQRHTVSLRFYRVSTVSSSPTETIRSSIHNCPVSVVPVTAVTRPQVTHVGIIDLSLPGGPHSVQNVYHTAVAFRDSGDLLSAVTGDARTKLYFEIGAELDAARRLRREVKPNSKEVTLIVSNSFMGLYPCSSLPRLTTSGIECFAVTAYAGRVVLFGLPNGCPTWLASHQLVRWSSGSTLISCEHTGRGPMLKRMDNFAVGSIANQSPDRSFDGFGDETRGTVRKCRVEPTWVMASESADKQRIHDYVQRPLLGRRRLPEPRYGNFNLGGVAKRCPRTRHPT